MAFAVRIWFEASGAKHLKAMRGRVDEENVENHRERDIYAPALYAYAMCVRNGEPGTGLEFEDGRADTPTAARLFGHLASKGI